MSMFTWFVLTVLLATSPLTAAYEDRFSCDAGPLSDGPVGATIELKVGNLPASSPDQDVILTWWAARPSAKAYSPLNDPSQADVFKGCSGNAYAKYNEPDWNGGKVRVTEAGEATLRVKAPVSYWKVAVGTSMMGSSEREPHVHFKICGGHGHSNKPHRISFTKDNGAQMAKTKMTGGCIGKYQKNVNYKLLSARELEGGAVVTPMEDESPYPEEKDWDSLEFSPIYQCLVGKELYDQFSSSCSTQCPAHADMAHGQCVRKPVSEGNKVALSASWSMHLDCNDKCWSAVIPSARHLVRLALADHMDITFQEADEVYLRRDTASPNTHARLKVTVTTNRLDADLGRSLYKSFLPNASVVTDLMGLTVHEVTHLEAQNSDDKLNGALPGENSDDYAEYYIPLETEAERKAQNGKGASIGGVEVPEDVPVPAIVGAAAGVVALIAAVAIWFHCRRRRQLSATNTSKQGAVKVEKNADEMIKEEDVDVKVGKTASV